MFFDIRSIIALDADINPSRRSLIFGATAAGIILAAPKIVRASSLMDIRGVPLARMEFIPCDGRILNECDEPELVSLFRQKSGRVVTHHFGPDDAAVKRLTHITEDEGGRQYGGAAEDKTFAVPNFSQGFDYDLGALASVNYEMDRKGELYLSVTPVDSMKDRVREEMRISYSRADVDTLLAGGRVKL